MKIELRKLKIFDAKDLMDSVNNKEVIPYLDSNRRYPINLDYTKKSIKKSLTDKNSYKRAIFVDGKFAGTISLYNPNKNKKIFEIGYSVARDYWNKGIATKAVKEICKFGFKKLKLKRIWAGTLSNNPSSSRVLVKAGFKQEGLLRCSFYNNGKYYNETIYAKLKK